MLVEVHTGKSTYTTWLATYFADALTRDTTNDEMTKVNRLIELNAVLLEKLVGAGVLELREACDLVGAFEWVTKVED